MCALTIDELNEINLEKIHGYIISQVGEEKITAEIIRMVYDNALRINPNKKNKDACLPLFKIAYDQIKDFRRRNNKRQTASIKNFSESRQKTLSKEQRLNIKTLHRIMLQITETQRDIIALRFCGGLSINEIAEILGKSHEVIKADQLSAIRSISKMMMQSTSAN
jgi:RNA polymerase sigma factor (sigma-70 family)